MPTDTPAGTRSAVAPSHWPIDSSWARSQASSTAVSSAALAIRWPLKAASAGATAHGSRVGSAPSAGTRWLRRTSTAAAVYSEEYSGSAMVTHSPYPSWCSVSTLTSRISREVRVANEVRNGATRGIAIRRSSTPTSFMPFSPDACRSHTSRPG